jgi:chromosome segregation ATPase
METPSKAPAASVESLWEIVRARDRALVETGKIYEARCAGLNEALASTKAYLAKVERARDEAHAATKQTAAYLGRVEQDRDEARAALQQTVAYLQSVEKDSAERLKSIEGYQAKLKEAYGDLERNVAYLKTLEAEIQAHLKVAAERDALIASLTAQLNAARNQPGPGQ